MSFLPAYAVDGGQLPAQMLRLVAWASTSGATGVVEVADLQVKATAVPSSQVEVQPGGAIIATKYAGGSAQQSYAVSNVDTSGDALLDVPATGSAGGRTDYVIYRIDDPQYGGQEPEDPLTATYGRLALVPSIDALTYPFVALARLDIPASTATITQAMITDLRQVANPRSLYVQRAHALVMGEEDTVSVSTGEVYPNAGGVQQIDIPEWATRLSIIVTWAQIRYEGGETSGRFWAEFGPYVDGSTREYATQQVGFNSDGVANSQRTVWIATDSVDVPASIRGTSQTFIAKARLDSGSGSSRPTMDSISSMSWQVQFLEEATQDA